MNKFFLNSLVVLLNLGGVSFWSWYRSNNLNSDIERLVENTEFRTFNTIANTISLNYISILNYFINRSTNASAESFNAKIKAFRAQFRGMKNVEFFLNRLTTIFAKRNNCS
ncbi:transposase [Arenibacter sp. F26102]|uniref:transposase n=1 Tax=Arenibacter sp. F26102 TaxID=2926416 RepID=UPI001FF5F9EA|nr:transposase [Arenibacter sp. F26102]MCK0144480.1 transposase [Arenibacter sp. F26102]